jgi:hypothetical protein
MTNKKEEVGRKKRRYYILAKKRLDYYFLKHSPIIRFFIQLTRVLIFWIPPYKTGYKEIMRIYKNDLQESNS